MLKSTNLLIFYRDISTDNGPSVYIISFNKVSKHHQEIYVDKSTARNTQHGIFDIKARAKRLQDNPCHYRLLNPGDIP